MVRIVVFGNYAGYRPLGFPRYNRKANRDQLTRKIFRENEINIRLYKFVHSQMGISGPIELEQKFGKRKHESICMRANRGERQFNPWVQMGRSGILHTKDEGWFEKYGYRKNLWR